MERCIAFAKVIFVPDDYYFNAPNVDIFGDAATLSTTKYVASPRSPLLSLSARDILDGWMVSSLSSPSSLSSLLLNVSFTVTADIPHAPAKFGNVSVDARAPPPSYLLRVDSNETNVNDSSSTFLLPNGGYLKFYDALEYDARPDYDTTFGVAVTIKSINPSGAAFFANVSIALLPSEKKSCHLTLFDCCHEMVSKSGQNCRPTKHSPRSSLPLCHVRRENDKTHTQNRERHTRTHSRVRFHQTLQREESERNDECKVRLETRFMQKPTNCFWRYQIMHAYRARGH